jgi:hypothetical protein
MGHRYLTAGPEVKKERKQAEPYDDSLQLSSSVAGTSDQSSSASGWNRFMKISGVTSPPEPVSGKRNIL